MNRPAGESTPGSEMDGASTMTETSALRAVTQVKKAHPVQPSGPVIKSIVSTDNADGELVRRTLDGDRSAFDVLINRYQRQAVSVSYRLLGSMPDALEVTQDAFLKSYTSLSTLEKRDAFGGWLMRIVSNLSLNYRRSRKVRSKDQLPLDDLLGGEQTSQQGAGSSEWSGKTDNPLHIMQSREMGAKLEQALKQLPEKQRLSIVMFTIDEMPQKDVAEALHCSVEAVKWHVFQGRKKLREMLKDVI